jgi:hypothetical protein
LNVITFFAGGMSLVSQKPGGAPPSHAPPLPLLLLVAVPPPVPDDPLVPVLALPVPSWVLEHPALITSAHAGPRKYVAAFRILDPPREKWIEGA